MRIVGTGNSTCKDQKVKSRVYLEDFSIFGRSAKRGEIGDGRVNMGLYHARTNNYGKNI